MATVSSHVLDAVAGNSAIGFRVQLFRLLSDSQRELVFDVVSDHEGRILQQVKIPQAGAEQEFELVFFSQDYFRNNTAIADIPQNMKTVVARFSMCERDKRYHIPLVLSPHSYTIWWSE